jgi:four helix bundle protein
MRSATSVASNYRAACRGRSRAEFAAKLGTVVEEADEALFWLELITEGKLMRGDALDGLLREANELVAIMVASHRTVRATGQSQIANPKSQMSGS